MAGWKMIRNGFIKMTFWVLMNILINFLALD